MRTLGATLAFACGVLCVSLPSCADANYVSLGGNLAAPILAADAGAPPALPSTSDSAPACPAPSSAGQVPLGDTCDDPAPPVEGCEPGAAAVVLAANCAQRREVSCSALAGAAAMTDGERLNLTLNELLRGCLEHINVLKVQLEGGCATRFELSMPNPSALACVSRRLESERYTCAASAICGRGEVFDVPTR
jgi:hypothetical protein